MKKLFCLCVAMIMMASLADCGESSAETKADTSKGSNTVQNVVEQQMNKADEEIAEEVTSLSNGEYDVDLTSLSSTMVYSEVYNMMRVPEEYIGKYVRAGGQFALYQATDEKGNPVPGQIYFACVIQDATACCAQGLEFVLEGDYVYPDDYPALGSEIVVSGIFETYEEDEYTYCHLVNAVME